MQVHIGCCGFPVSAERYFQKFSTVELQSTFYKLPRLKTAHRWREEAPENFHFCLKAHQAITHPTTSPTWRRSGLSQAELTRLKGRCGYLRPTREVWDGWQRTLEIARALHTQVILVQCPASFRCTEENIAHVKKFFSSVERDGIHIAFEPRGDWLENPKIIRELVNELNLIHCVDPFWDEPQSAHPVAYLRLHGLGRRYNYRYAYTERDLSELVAKMRKLDRLGKEEVYCFMNNLRMWQDAAHLQELWKSLGKL